MSPLFGRSSQPEQSGPRSAEERERARREREARRAAREGRPVPPAFAGDDGTGNGNGHVVDEPAPPAFVEEEPAPQTWAEEPAAVEEPPPAEEPAPQAWVHESVAADEPAEPAEPAGSVSAFAQAPDDFAPIEPRNEFAEEPVSAPESVGEPQGAAVAWDDPVAPEPVPEATQEPAADTANGGAVPADSWFDDPAPASPAPEPAVSGTGEETVEWDALANAPRDRVGSVGDAEPVDAEPRVQRLDPPVTPRATGARPSGPLPTAAARRPVYGDEDERPVPPKRVPRAGRTLPPPPPPPGERRGRPGRRGRRIAVLVVVALILGAVAVLYNALYQPFAGDPGQRTRVVIPSESTASDIGRLLQNAGVVQSATFFTLRTRMDGANLKAGTYQLREDMKYGDAIKALSAGPPAVRTISVTIPEGRSRRETRSIVQDAGLRGSYLEASERAKGFRPSRYGAPRDVASLEGFLFPATYELRPNATSRQLVRRQLAAFRENIAKVSMRRARARNLDVYDVLIIASMVEREATLAKERRLVASVIYNRLRQGMPLGIDATIRFAVRNWTRPLRVSELETDSPYNTRKRTGLPPGPIGSPGLASIRAAANPAKTDFLFYVVKPNGDGAHNFSATDAEFQRDVAAYNRERDRRGGQDPSSSDGG